MAELTCLNCIEYDEDGRLATQLDPDGLLECDGNDEIGFAAEIQPRVLNTAIAGTICNSSAYVNAAGELWADPRPCAVSDEGIFDSLPNTTVNAGVTYVNPPANITLPANDNCYTIRYKLNISRTIIFLSATNTPTQYTISDSVGGSTFLSGIQHQENVNTGVSRILNQNFSIPFALPPGAGATAVPMVLTMQNLSATTNISLPQIRYRWTYTGIAIKDC